ncbi:AMOTL [Acanthosepion pharaonis]|uniref:AMOTL n=1 Tax=Acanthosepion pharaonis TaxID=158019 RepID=A0A812EWF0_ACAPH|nr:AMOTL [Sepia pharaonis]
MQSSPYRDPPPYPGHSKQLLQPGLRQSFSGSETSTDVSLSSSENLSTCQRQEPQGEETHPQEMYYDLKPMPEGYSMLARLGMHLPVDVKNLNDQTVFATNNQHTMNNIYMTPSTQYYSTTIPLTVPSTWENNPIITGPTDSRIIPLNATVSMPSNIAYTNQCFSQQNMDPQVLQYLSNLPPPPEYKAKSDSESSVKKDLRRSYEMLDKVERTRSQPDLTRFGDSKFRQPSPQGSQFYAGEKSPENKGEVISIMQAKDGDKIERSADTTMLLARTTTMVEILTSENKTLREKNKTLQEELIRTRKRVAALQKCEQEITKVTDEYKTLEQKSRKLQQWEAAYRQKLEEENKKLMAENKSLKEQLQGVSNPLTQEMTENDMRTELRKKEAIVANLMSVNKELQGSKEQMHVDVVKSRQTVEQQRSEIDILDNALTNAQSNVVRLEEECKKKQLYMERLDQLQKAFGSLQLATEKREQMEQQLRNKLENELEQLRQQELWEQRCLAETAKKQSEQNTNLGDKDNQIAVFEKSALEMEKLLSESKSEKLRHMEEAFQAKKKAAELEARVKELQTSLVEKEAMVKALQRSTLGRSNGVHTLHCTPLHSSLISTGSLTRQASTSQVDDPTFRDFGLIKHTKSGSTSDIGLTTSFAVDTSCQDKLNVSSDSDEKNEEFNLWQV